jgi:hypothetical protein
MCMLILFMLYINTIIVEGSQNNIGGANNIASINTIDDLRDFLEKMYMICIANPNQQITSQSNDKISQTNPYKIGILGTYLWPLLGPLSEQSIEDLTEKYGISSAPLSQMQLMSKQTNPNPPPIPIIQSDKDYVLLLQLAILGSMITSFSTYPANGGNSVTIWYQDAKGLHDYYNYGRNPSWGNSIYFSNLYLSQITMILAHFHGQTNKSNGRYSGDSAYTQLYIPPTSV